MSYAQKIVDKLNEARAFDSSAVQRLFEHRVKCNAKMAGHPTIQVRQETVGDPATVSLLGMLNHIIADDGVVIVATVLPDTGYLMGFKLMQADEFPGRPAGTTA